MCIIIIVYAMVGNSRPMAILGKKSDARLKTTRIGTLTLQLQGIIKTLNMDKFDEKLVQNTFLIVRFHTAETVNKMQEKKHF